VHREMTRSCTSPGRDSWLSRAGARESEASAALLSNSSSAAASCTPLLCPLPTTRITLCRCDSDSLLACGSSLPRWPSRAASSPWRDAASRHIS
jgi:hypothetical protein